MKFVNSAPTTPALIAVAVDDTGGIAPHAGRARRWQVYATSGEPATAPELVWELTLSASGCLHEWHVRGDGNRHPLHSVDIAIAGSGGEGVIRRLAERHTTLVGTAATEPRQAVQDYLAGTLLPGRPHAETECLQPEAVPGH